MSVPKLRFKEFKEQLLKTTFKKVVSSNQYGPRFNANDYHIDGNVKTIRGTDISLDGEIKYSQVPIAKLDFNFIENHILKDGDLVMITTAECGVTGVFRKQNFNYIPSAYAVKITLNEKGNPDYFKYFFQTRQTKAEIKSFIRKATVANLPCSDILRIKLNLPSISEQTKIADFLITIDEKFAQLTQKCELLARYKKGVMQQLFSQQLRFKDDDGRDFPDWELYSLSELGEFKNGINKSSEDFGHGVPFVNLMDVFGQPYFKSKSLDLVNAKPNEIAMYNLLKGDVLFIRSSVKIQGVGETSVILEDLKDTVYSGFLIRFREKSKKIDLLFKKYCFSNPSFRNQVLSVCTTSANTNINQDSLSNLTINLPSLQEQTKIANFLTTIDEKITQTQTYLETVKQYKQGLLQQMFL